MQTSMQKYANKNCKKLQKIAQYAKNLHDMQKICKKYAEGQTNMQLFQCAKYAKNMQNMCKKYVKHAVSSYANYGTYMQIMHPGLCC